MTLFRLSPHVAPDARAHRTMVPLWAVLAAILVAQAAVFAFGAHQIGLF